MYDCPSMDHNHNYGTYRWWYAIPPPAHHTGVYGGTYHWYGPAPQGDVVLEPTGVLDWVY